MHGDALAKQLEQFGLLLVHVALENATARFGGDISALLLGKPVASRLVEVVHATLQHRDPSVERLQSRSESLRRLGRQERQRAARERSRREYRLHPVIVLGRDRVELVVVAPRAAEGKSEERLTDMVSDIVEEQLARHGRDSHARVLPRAAPQEAGRDDRLRIVGKQFVSRDLLEHEAVERLVLVEAANHVVAIAPRIGSLEVVGIARSVRVARHVQPMPSPPLAVARGIEQALHQVLVSRLAVVRYELFHLRRSRGQAREVERDAAD